MKRFFSMILAVFMFFSVFSMPEGVFATSGSKALRSYAVFLGKHKAKNYTEFVDASFEPKDKSYVNKFATIDIDNNGTKELLTYTTVNNYWTIIRIYRYQKGKVMPYKFSSGSNVVFNDCATADGRYGFYICEAGHIHNVWMGSYGNSSHRIYQISKGKVKLYLRKDVDTLLGDGTPVIKKYGEQISQYKYRKLTAKCKYEEPTTKYDIKNLDWVKNNEANRRKI